MVRKNLDVTSKISPGVRLPRPQGWSQTKNIVGGQSYPWVGQTTQLSWKSIRWPLIGVCLIHGYSVRDEVSREYHVYRTIAFLQPHNQIFFQVPSRIFGKNFVCCLVMPFTINTQNFSPKFCWELEKKFDCEVEEKQWCGTHDFLSQHHL